MSRARNTFEVTHEAPDGEVVVRSRTGVTNYYGEVDLCEINGVPFLALDDHSGLSLRQVSEAFAKAWLREFGTA